MAYMDQNKKAKIAAKLKEIKGLKGWKYSLKVDNHSTILMTIRSAPFDLIEHMVDNVREGTMRHESSNVAQYMEERRYHQCNHYSLERLFSGEVLETMKQVVAALNTDNHDRSDIQSDYFDIGHFVNLNVGAWNKPFEVKA